MSSNPPSPFHLPPSSTCDALLLVSFGGPEGPEDVLPFLENVVRGKDVPESDCWKSPSTTSCSTDRVRSIPKTVPC